MTIWFPISNPLPYESINYCIQGEMKSHPTNCNAYLECVHDGFMERYCRAHLHFNEVMQYCDYPYNVNCSSEETEPEGPTTIPTAPTTEIDAETPIYPSTEASTVYPSSLPTTESPNPPIPTSCADLSTGGNLPHPNCKLFYHCNDGFPTEICCGFGRHYSIALNNCVAPNIANCTEGAAPEQPEAILTVCDFREPHCETDANNLLLPHPNNNLLLPHLKSFTFAVGEYYTNRIVHMIYCSTQIFWFAIFQKLQIAFRVRSKID